jgi:hypothetical protein
LLCSNVFQGFRVTSLKVFKSWPSVDLWTTLYAKNISDSLEICSNLDRLLLARLAVVCTLNISAFSSGRDSLACDWYNLWVKCHYWNWLSVKCIHYCITVHFNTVHLPTCAFINVSSQLLASNSLLSAEYYQF